MSELTEQNIKKIQEDFQTKYNKSGIGKYNFSSNDKLFLQKLNRLYGNALSVKGINLIDPIEANLFHYNKMHMNGMSDIPRVTRSYVFFTRPELNFSFENINSVPFFKWLYSKRIGKMIMTMLTDPSYFINAPTALNASSATPAQIQKIYQELATMVAKAETNVAQNDSAYLAKRQQVSDDSYNDEVQPKAANYDETTEGTDEEKAKIEADAESSLDTSINLDEITDADINDIYKANEISIKSAYANFDTAYQQYLTNFDKIMTNSGIGVDGSSNYESKLNDLNIHRASSWMNFDKKGAENFNFTSPFIPLLGNCCTSLDGAKDINMEVHTYEEDHFSSNLTVPKGFDELWSSGSISTSFEDIAYSPCALLFMVYLFYVHYVSRGHIMTVREHDTERVLDYTISIYNFVVGDDGRRIERWAKYTGCYPTNFPFSQQILHQIALDPEMLHKFSISWNYNRYEPMDPQAFTDFNFLSESEWLCKLKPELWENLYDRKGVIRDDAWIDFSNLDSTRKAYSDMILRSLKRPKNLWDVIQPSDRGMSGLPPPALVDSDYDHKITNYWGGYPYVNNGTELIWVMPEFSTTNGEVIHDEISSGNQIKAPAIVNNATTGSDQYQGVGPDPTTSKAGTNNLNNIRSYNV